MKILAIGNSFSDDATAYLEEVLHALGEKEIFLGNLYIPGCSLAAHAENAKTGAPVYEYRTNCGEGWKTTLGFSLPRAAESQPWDVISMQQASYDSGNPDSFSALKDLIAFVRKAAGKNARLAWHMTWAYQTDSTHGGFAAYNNDQRAMYDAILNAVQTCILPEKQFELLFPVGTAMQNVRTSFLGDALTRDGYHLSIPFGRYVAALTWARVLTGRSVENIPYAPGGVDERSKAVAVEATENAIRTPFSVTESKLK